MATPTAVRRPDTHDMIVVHRIFRRESDLMPRLIQAVPDGDTGRAQVLADTFGDYQTGLHFHHSAEDDLVWPLLLARIDLEADMVLRMEAQHEVIARTLEEAAQRMAAWRSAPSAAEWARLGEHFAEEVPKAKMLFFLGAILEDATPAERQAMLANPARSGPDPLAHRRPWPVPPQGPQDPRRARPRLTRPCRRGSVVLRCRLWSGVAAWSGVADPGSAVPAGY
jgi:hemerythrin HHE cation binding domain-containing protein